MYAGAYPAITDPPHNPHRSPRIYGVLPTNSQPGFKAKRIAPCTRGFTPPATHFYSPEFSHPAYAGVYR